MNTKDIFEETEEIENEISKLRNKINNLNMKYHEITKLCHHEIVFEYKDDHPRKSLIYTSYFCPACNKLIKCFALGAVYDTDFKKSRIIPLTNLSLLGTPKNLNIIKNEVYNNIDTYYNSSISTQELSSKMEDLLEDMQYKYEDPAKVFIKKNKR